MQLDPVSLTRDLVAVKSVSRWSNALISDLVEERFREHGFETERLDYVDENGEAKVSIVGRKGLREREGSPSFPTPTRFRARKRTGTPTTRRSETERFPDEGPAT